MMTHLLSERIEGLDENSFGDLFDKMFHRIGWLRSRSKSKERLGRQFVLSDDRQSIGENLLEEMVQELLNGQAKDRIHGTFNRLIEPTVDERGQNRLIVDLFQCRPNRLGGKFVGQVSDRLIIDFVRPGFVQTEGVLNIAVRSMPRPFRR